MPRINMKKIVEGTWKSNGATFPPELGTKVRMWDPAHLRGEMATVVATDKAAKKDIKIAPKGKLRVKVGDDYVVLCQNQALPSKVTVKMVEKLAAE